jgi:exopolysaccharide production protein ExoQ
MPAPLALLGCLVFVILLLRQESKQSVGVTSYLWVPTIWFLLICSRPLALWFGVGGETNEEGSPWDRVFLTGLFVVAVVRMNSRQFPWAIALREHRSLVVLIGFMFVSMAWSETPLITLKRWFREGLIAVTICLSVLSEPSPRGATESIIRRIIYICIPFSYILIHYFPQYGRMYVHREGIEMWTGVTGHKNQLAQLCLISFLYISWKIAMSRLKGDRIARPKLALYFDVAILALTLLVFMGPNRSITYSATTLLSTLAGLGVLGFLQWHLRRGTLPASFLFTSFSAFLISYGTFTTFLGKLAILDVSRAVGRTENLTGRGDVWASLFPAVIQQPILGYGYGGFWSTEARERYDITDAHNGYLGVILETGFVGWFLCAVFLVSAIVTAQRLLRTERYWPVFCLMFSVSVLLHNIGEASLTSFSTQLTASFLLLHISCSPIAKSTETTQCGTGPVVSFEEQVAKGNLAV